MKNNSVGSLVGTTFKIITVIIVARSCFREDSGTLGGNRIYRTPCQWLSKYLDQRNCSIIAGLDLPKFENLCFLLRARTVASKFVLKACDPRNAGIADFQHPRLTANFPSLTGRLSLN